MAARKPARQKPDIEGQALQLEKLDPQSQRAARENWREMGMVTQHHAEAVQKTKESLARGNLNPSGTKKAQVRLRSLEVIKPHIEDKPITLGGATQARIERVHEARGRAQEEGHEVPRGTGWYFDHHAQIANMARQHGVDPSRAITATTGMSPQNDPETERKAGGAMMDMVGNQDKHTVHITPEVHAATAEKIDDLNGPAIPKEWIGKHVKLGDMHAAQIAGIASKAAEMREAGIKVHSTAPFENLGAARNADKAVKGIQHLRGDIPEEEVIDPHSSPKVWSYKEATKGSVPGSETHLEYLARAQDFQKGGTRGLKRGLRRPVGVRTETPEERTQRRTEQAQTHQQMRQAAPGSQEHSAAAMRLSLQGIGTKEHTRGRLKGQTSHNLPDLRPMRGSDEGVLSPMAHTAEDTWMQSISTRQKPDIVRTEEQPGGTGTSIAKHVASDPNLASEKRMRKTAPSGASVVNDPRIKNAALLHALNNYSTRHAARLLGGLPATMVQEVPWTEQRIQASKDPEYAREVRTGNTGPRTMPKQPAPLGRQFPGAPSNPVTPLHHAAAKALYDRVTGGGSVSQHEVEHAESLRRNAK